MLTSKWPRIAAVLVPVVLSLALVNVTASEAEAFDPGAAATAVGATLAGGAELVGEATAAGACAASVVCAGAVAVGSTAMIAGIAYQQHDTWWPWVKGVVGAAFSHGGDSAAASCSGAASVRLSGAAMYVDWSAVGCPNTAYISVGVADNGTVGCQSSNGAVQVGTEGGTSISTVDLGSGSGTWTINGICGSGQTAVFESRTVCVGSLGTGWAAGVSGSTWVCIPTTAGTSIPAESLSQTTSIDCLLADGSTVTLTGTTTGTDGQVPMPSCQAADPGSVPTKIVVKAGWPGAEQTQATVALKDPHSMYPDCFDANGAFLGTCKVRVWINGSPCQVGQAACLNWQTTADDGTDTVECRMGSYVIPLSSCSPLKRSYDPTTGTQLLTAVDPNTGAPVDPNLDPDPSASPTPSTGALPTTGANPSTVPNPDPTPDPGTEPQPDPDPESQNCWGSGWSWNPVSWVYVPVKCALEWAFVPPSGYAGSLVGELQTSFDGTEPGKYLSALVDASRPPSVAPACGGIPVHYDLGIHGHTTPVDFNLGAACPGDTLATAAGICKTVLSATIIIGGIIVCTRSLVYALLGYDLVSAGGVTVPMKKIADGEQ
jgi:hypothetical protein